MAGPITVSVRIKRLAGSQDIPLPIRMSEHASGFDLPAAVPQAIVVQPNQIALVPCGFAIALPPGYEAQIRPRSGLASRHGITLINTPGTIDADYRGQVQVPVINLGQTAFTIERGMRIAQMVIVPVPRIELIEVTDLDDTTRGVGGFGHTGT